MCSASGDGDAESKRSPATTTRSTSSRRASATVSSSTARCSPARLRPARPLPTCQSAVCRSFTSGPGLRKALKGILGAVARGARPGPRLARASRPRGEGELAHQRHRDLGLRHHHRARLHDGDPVARGAAQEAVLPALGLGRVETPGDPDRGLAHDAILDLARSLLRAYQDDPKRAPALRDVEQYLLYGARALPRRVLVELVEHQEEQGPRLARAFLALERAPHDHTYDEALGAVGEVVKVDDRDLLVELYAVTGSARDVTADDPPQRLHRAVQTAYERVDGPGPDHGPGPVLLLDLARDEPGKLCEGANLLAFDAYAPLGQGRRVAQLRRHVVDHHRVVLPVVLRIRETERKELLAAELLERPEERSHPVGAAGDVRGRVRIVDPRRSEHPDARERARFEPEPAIAVAVVVAQLDVGVIEVQEVFALDGEDQGLRVQRLATQC